MKKIVTHKSSDLDAISSVWLIKRYLPGWEDAEVHFVPAGEKLPGVYAHENEAIEIVDGFETIHVDTGMGVLDHHQTADNNVCAASLTFDYVLKNEQTQLHKRDHLREAVRRTVEIVINDDHFQEVYYPDATNDVYETGIVAMIQGYKILHRQEDDKLVEFTFELLDTIIHNLEAKIWAENEIKEKGIEFESHWGKAIAVETLNDEVLKHSQMIGYIITVRRDPSHGYIRIKALPDKRLKISNLVTASEARQSQEIASSQTPRNDIENSSNLGIDLTEAYEKLKSMDPEATWFLHASKRMLLNGSSKNPNMKVSTLTLEQVIEVLKK